MLSLASSLLLPDPPVLETLADFTGALLIQQVLARRPGLVLGKAFGIGEDWKFAPDPPPGVGEMARMEGSLTQSGEGLGGSPDQVVGQGLAV